MTALRTLYHLARADFLERVRRYSFLVLLGLTVILWRTGKLREKTIAYATIIAFALILFAAVGTLLFCGTWHDFSSAA